MKTQRRTGLRAITSRIVILMGISLMLFTIFPHNVSAETPGINQLDEEAKVFTTYQSVLNQCIQNKDGENFLESDIDTGGNVSANGIYSQIFDTFNNISIGGILGGKRTLHDYTVFPGKHVSSTGVLNCRKDGGKIFSVLGFDSHLDVLNLFYKKTGDNTYKLKSGNYRNAFEKTVASQAEVGPDGSLNTLSPAAEYRLILQQLKGQCGLKGPVDADTYTATSENNKALIWEVKDGEVVSTPQPYTINRKDSDVIFLGVGVGVEDSLNVGWDNIPGITLGYRPALSVATGLAKCSTLMKRLSFNKQLATAYAKVAKADGVSGSIDEVQVSGPVTGDETEDSCESQSGVTAWIMCPAINIVGGALNWVDVQLTKLMEIDNNKYSTADGDNALYSAWSKFRNIGLTLLIAAMLVMVISTALGVGALDAYTVKKAFPRMVVSVIFMMLSWYVCVFLIDVSNVVGRGTLGLMTSPFGSSASSLSSLFSTTSGADIAGGTVVSLGGLTILGSAFAIPGAAAILFSWLGTGLLVMLIAFLTLIARQMFVLVLILGAPIAILSWIFPGNDKLWKLWWSSFSKLLLMFPMVMALIASGRIFAGATNSITDASTGESLLNVIIKFTAYVVPYAFIPLTFKAAGGVFGNLAGMANDRSKGAFDRLKKGRQKNQAEIGQRMGAGQGFRGSQRNVLNRASSGIAAGPKGWNPVSSRKRNAIRQSKMANLGASSTKDNEIYQANKNDDNFLLAVASKDLANEKLRAAKKNLDKAAPNSAEAAKYQQEVLARESAIAAANSITGRNQATQRQAALDLAATGYQLSYGQKGIDELREIGQATSGGDQGAFSAFMNTAQYNAKGAGRTDLGGLNAGASFNTDTKEGRKAARDAVKSGIRKVNGFTRGNGKGDTYTGGADAWLGEGTVGKDGKVLEGDALTSRISQNYKSGEVELGEVAQWHSMLLNDHAQASDANKIIIQKQIDAIEKVEEQYKTEIPVDVPDQERRTAFMAELSENRKKISRNNMDPNIRDTL